MSSFNEPISCITQECYRMHLLLEQAIKNGNCSYVLSDVENYLMQEYPTELEKYFDNNNIQITKKYKKTETGKISIYTLSFL